MARLFGRLPGCAVLFGWTYEQTVSRIDEGKFLIVFDVSLQPNKCTFREIRVLPQSVEDFSRGISSDISWEQVARAITPHDGASLTMFELLHVLNSSKPHVCAMLRRKLFTQVPNRDSERAFRVSTASYLELMKRRRFF